jgi:eukaryotic-like serine/threonine-protein kinase
MEYKKLEEELFAAVLCLPAAERDDFLTRACDGAPCLKERLRSLIRVVDSTISSKNRQFMAPPENIGDQIDNYRLVREIGEGGCGVVYLAEQVAPMRREVALKIIRLGMDSRDVMARFEAERQVLALMDHPNIAKVLDAGATASGRPYFVMELVRGIKITDYCNQVRLTVSERVELLMQVCLAIQHAHHKDIVHRDIKPSNVLVTLVDGVPIVKVIDFGIAKATQGRLTEETLRTAMEQFVGTPAYVSPEQTEPGSVGVDARSDVYSLGVLLYELLTQCRPFDADQTSLTAFANLRQRIRTAEPIRPSIRIANHDRLEEVAALYRVSAQKLIQQVRGDLDWIVLCCLEKEQVHRYQTANALWSDLRQHLLHWPIAARPRGTLYSFGKFARRHRVAFNTMLVIALVLTGSAFGTAYMAVQAKRANRLAGEVSVLLETAIIQGQPMQKIGPGVVGEAYKETKASDELARTLFEAGKAGRERLVDDPLAEAAIRESFGSSYAAFGMHRDAQLQFEQALRMYRRTGGPEDPRSLAAAGALARSLSWQGHDNEAASVARDALTEVLRSRRLLHPKTWAFRTVLAFYLYRQGQFASSKALLEPYIVHWETRIGRIDLAALEASAIFAPMSDTTNAAIDRIDFPTLEMMAILAPIYAREGRTARAMELARTVAAVRRLRLGTAHQMTAQALLVLADVYVSSGRMGLAADAFVTAATSQRRLEPGYEEPNGYSPTTLQLCSPSAIPQSDPSRPHMAEYEAGKSEFDDQHARLKYPGANAPESCRWVYGFVEREPRQSPVAAPSVAEI